MPPDFQDKKKTYMRLLRKWQRSINLVSNSTLGEAERRHFDDSLQLLDLLPEQGVLFDIGSGAGFPGLVLAMARPDLDVTLIESDTKKCTFLSTVSRETQTPVNIVNDRIESVSRETIPAIVTARALAALDKLLYYCLPWAEANRELEMLFLKGENVAAEIAAAEKKYSFESAVLPSKTGNGAVVRVWNLNPKPVS